MTKVGRIIQQSYKKPLNWFSWVYHLCLSLIKVGVGQITLKSSKNMFLFLFWGLKYTLNGQNDAQNVAF